MSNINIRGHRVSFAYKFSFLHSKSHPYSKNLNAEGLTNTATIHRDKQHRLKSDGHFLTSFCNSSRDLNIKFYHFLRKKFYFCISKRRKKSHFYSKHRLHQITLSDCIFVAAQMSLDIIAKLPK